MLKYIPNTITSLNLFCGSIAVVQAFAGRYDLAFLFMVVAAVCDFFDGFAARLIKNAHSAIGKELDSLADMVSFGFAPSVILFSVMGGSDNWLSYSAFVVAVFSALRLAKFNVDTRQTTEFRGMPTPANAMMIGAIGYLVANGQMTWFAGNDLIIIVFALVMSALLVCDIPMFALKFKSYALKANMLVYSFLLVSLVLIILMQVAAVPVIIGLYIVVSVVKALAKR